MIEIKTLLLEFWIFSMANNWSKRLNFVTVTLVYIMDARIL